ncbi:hypothetical protein F9B85_04650 [Heliorestis acidaminivorans]|uniref:Uncharacterized protein n=1 Tax=Heliorestis acidaminivorans TaxID=553427 RepID=A0A6I0F4Z5_9FIRM|nr:hypothetical protein [Heliorestis acidaminivorans]KAB2953902.1 hypothetical protein F9B85_04650 [Heliorestis acidaminivorans]
MSEGIFGMVFVLVLFSLITTVIVVAITQALKTARAKTANMAELARDEAYRKLAEEVVSVQRKMSEDQQKIVKDLSEMKVRINAIEKMLREVD